MTDEHDSRPPAAGERPAAPDAIATSARSSATGAPPSAPSARRSAAYAAALVVVLAASIQTGSALAVRVIASVGIIEALWLRTAFAALILIVVRPHKLRLPARGHRLPLALLSMALLGMNLSFYGAITRAPVGIVVAIEFVGPLAVAVLGTRRRIDWLWIVLAGVGVVVLAGPSGGAGGWGVVLALTAGTFWGLYLLLAKRAVTGLDPFSVTTLMMLGSTALLTPVLLMTGVSVSGHLDAIALGIVIAVVSSAFPYLLELVALNKVRAATYGVLLSIEPAIAALAGFVVLGQRISPVEAAAMGAVMAAAAGASWTSGGAGEQGVDLPAP